LNSQRLIGQNQSGQSGNEILALKTRDVTTAKLINMTTKLKSRIAIVALIVGGLAFLDGASVLCYCPESFILPAALSILSALLGSRWIRITSICLFVASIVMAMHDYKSEKHLERLFQAVQEKERTNTNSISK